MKPSNVSAFAVTAAGLARLENELNFLCGDRKMALIERIEEARSGAELVENTELLSALEELNNLNQRIDRIRYLLRHARLIEDQAPDGRVHLGSRVTIQFAGEEPEQFRLVGTIEADPDAGYISDISPIGRVIINRPASDMPLHIETPAGPRELRILKVE